MEINNNGSVIMGVCHFCELHGPCVVFHTRLQLEESAKAASRNNQFPISSNTSCTVNAFIITQRTVLNVKVT